MLTELPPMRRIVTGTGPDGRSRIVEDGEPPVISTVATRPGLRNANIWSTNATPAPVDAPGRIAEHKGLYPPENGTVIRVMDIPPEPQDPEKLKRGSAQRHRRFFPIVTDVRPTSRTSRVCTSPTPSITPSSCSARCTP